MEDFYALNVKGIWQYFKAEHFSFWMICGYLFVEYVRPQSIFTWLDFLPWGKVFVAGALLSWLADPKKKWVSSPINKWMVAFFFSILASSYLAYSPAISYAKLAEFYTWFVVYFLIINIVNTRKRFFIFLLIFLVASYKISLSLSRVWAFRGFSFTDWGLMGPPGFFQNSGELAIQMAVFWPIALAAALYLKPYVKRWKYLILISMPLTACMVIMGSSSRGGQLALVGQLLVRYFNKLHNFRIIVMIGVIVASGWWLLPDEQKTRFTAVGNDKTSQQRLLYWENGINMLREHPFFGVGYFNFVPYYERYHAEDMLYSSAELPHNIFVQVGADLGGIGLIAFFGLLISSVSAVRRVNKYNPKNSSDMFFIRLAAIMNISLLGFIIAGQFVSVVYYPFLWIHLALVVSLCNVSSEQPQANR